MARLARIAGGSLLALYVGASITFPSLHRANCSDKNSTHDDDSCPACQVANTPVVSLCSGIVPVANAVAVDDVVVRVSIYASSSLRNPTQARAPPVC